MGNTRSETLKENVVKVLNQLSDTANYHVKSMRAQAKNRGEWKYIIEEDNVTIKQYKTLVNTLGICLDSYLKNTSDSPVSHEKEKFFVNVFDSLKIESGKAQNQIDTTLTSDYRKLREWAMISDKLTDIMNKCYKEINSAKRARKLVEQNRKNEEEE